MEVIFVSKDTNVNPVHKKDRAAPRMKYINLDGAKFNVTMRNENLRKRIRAMRSVFRLSPAELYPMRLPQWVSSKKFESKENPKDNPSEEPPKKYTGPNHFPITSMANPCIRSLDLEGCIRKYNTAYQAINRLPDGPLGERFLESMIRQSLQETFAIVFGKDNVDSVAVINFEPIDDVDVENFGLKTYYNVKFVLHSNTVDLEPDHVKNALLKKCARLSTNPENEEYMTCAIENQAILVLNNLDLEEYDVCERDILKCHEFNECYNRKKREPDNFNFEVDQVAFECRCRDGFRSIAAPAPHFSHFVNHTCEDINECESPDLHNCDPVSTLCHNTPGSFECRCQKGYKPSNSSHCIGKFLCFLFPSTMYLHWVVHLTHISLYLFTSELCSDSQCINGNCRPIGDHEDYCE